jgi:hypothetical protein
VLAVCCAAQFMVVLDIAIANVALPRMRDSRGLSVAGEQRVASACTLRFAGLLLLGRRVGDLFDGLAVMATVASSIVRRPGSRRTRIRASPA